MRYTQTKAGLLVPDRSIPRSPKYQRGFLGAGVSFFNKTAGGGSSGSGDSFFSSVFSLLPMSGTDGSTTFTDQISGRAWTPTGDAEIVTAQSPFADDSSGSFGTGYLTTNTLGDWKFLHDGSTPWTIDIWVYVNALGATRGIFGTNQGSSAKVGVGVWIDSTGHGHFFMTAGGGVSILNFTTASALFTAGAWYLVSAQWNNATSHLNFFVNGVDQANTSGSSGYSASNPSLALNVAALGGGSLPLDGYASNFRCTKALRYSGNFSPPASPWPTHG